MSSLPDFIIIGGKKCATSSLHFYLGLHPEIHVSREKELHYFSKRRNKPLDWYKSWFPHPELVQGEASPSYAAYPLYTDIPELIHEACPECKLIYIVRDPIERAISDYWHEIIEGKEDRPITVLRDLDSLYFQRGRYAMQLSKFLPYFELGQIHIVDQAELKNQRSQTLATVFRFLGVDDTFQTTLAKWERHKSARKFVATPAVKRIRESFAGRTIAKLPSHRRWLLEEVLYRPFSTRSKKPDLDGETRNILAEAYAPDVARLRELLNRSFPNWSI